MFRFFVNHWDRELEVLEDARYYIRSIKRRLNLKQINKYINKLKGKEKSKICDHKDPEP